MERILWILAALNGFLAVALGAFGAHGLQRLLDGVEDAAKRLEWWQTASQYHLAHALALGLTAAAFARLPEGTVTVAGYCFLGGILVFSGSLYAMTLTGTRALGAITPIGGLLLLAGWGALLLAAWRS